MKFILIETCLIALSTAYFVLDESVSGDTYVMLVFASLLIGSVVYFIKSKR